MPSYVEGWGMPITEAVISSTPVICNDIEVFHESGYGQTEMISVESFEMWKEAILKHMNNNFKKPNLSNVHPVRWDEHFEFFDKCIDGNKFK